ncbi:MAG: ABC transporter ATP-binding protein [Candidatus Dojkabacteria bacterium]
MHGDNKGSKQFFKFLSKYKFAVLFVALLSIGINGLTLLLPRVTSRAIDSLFPINTFDQNEIIFSYGILSTIIFLGGVLLSFLSNLLAERMAYDIRQMIAKKLSKQSFSYITTLSTSKILTNLTSDVDAVKNFITQGIVVVFSSLILLFGSAISLLTINWQLSIPVLLIVPILFVSFGLIFARISKYFTKAQEIIDRLNRIINETIVGAPIIRVLNSQKNEKKKFEVINQDARQTGIKIVNGFAFLVPFISFLANVSILIVLGYGGIQVIDQSLSPGNFAAFFTYVGTFITPIILLGFLGTVFTRAFASYNRIAEILNAKVEVKSGTLKTEIKGNFEFKNVSLTQNKTEILKDITFEIQSGTRTAIIGPTASGKTQLIYLLSGLLYPTKGEIILDNRNINDYSNEYLYSQIGIVFQDSVLFNTSIRENIAFKEKINEKNLEKAIKTAELDELVKKLDKGIDTIISERGASLSGGQKQRLTLARALALNPKVLILDDFTARVDIKTEAQIFKNIRENYKGITIISVTQKIDPIKDYDQIFLIMEGELLAKGKHEDLLATSFEYQQIFSSQKSITT